MRQIGRFSELRYRPLAFTQELETRFERSTEVFRRKRIWLEGLGAIGLYGLFCLIQKFLMEDQVRVGLILRLGVVLPLALAVNTSMLFRLPSWIQEAGVLSVACLAGSVELFLNNGAPAVIQAYAQFSIVAVLVFTNTVMRLRPKYALIALLWAIGANLVFVVHSHALSEKEKLFGFLLTSIIGVVTVIANYSQGRQERLAFLREYQKDTLVGELARSNHDLAAVAHTDSLTGLANRAGLNSHLEQLWSSLRESGGMLSVILVDVDHFKGLNDEFGHLYGDKVLVRVARLLAEALRREDDFIARFGGEEFLILLPNTPPHLALLVAERLRSLVELAGLPALSGNDPRLRGRQATVSCGVASAPALSVSNALEVLHAADEALYTAKRTGRNRVHMSMSMEDQGRAEAIVSLALNL